MTRTKWVYAPPEESDGHRILLMRFWPRGRTRQQLALFEWARELAPSPELLGDWKAGRITWEQYTARYVAEMAGQKEKIAELARLADAGTITLLCNERDHDPHCHRHILKKLIELSQEQMK